MQGAARLVAGIVLEAAVSVGLELDPVSAAVEGVASKGDDVQGIHDRVCVGDFLGAAVLKPVKPSIGTISIWSGQVLGRGASQVLNACLE